MTIVEQIRARIQKAIKENNIEKDILRIFLTKLQQTSANDTTEVEITNERCIEVARSIIKGNKEAITLAKEKATPEYVAKLEAENKVMKSFLPSYLSAEETKEILTKDADIMTAILAAKNDGAAMGIAMKYFKTKDLKVEGNTVKEVIGNRLTPPSGR